MQAQLSRQWRHRCNLSYVTIHPLCLFGVHIHPLLALHRGHDSSPLITIVGTHLNTTLEPLFKDTLAFFHVNTLALREKAWKEVPIKLQRQAPTIPITIFCTIFCQNKRCGILVDYTFEFLLISERVAQRLSRWIQEESHAVCAKEPRFLVELIRFYGIHTSHMLQSLSTSQNTSIAGTELLVLYIVLLG